MREVTLNELATMASDAREAIWDLAENKGKYEEFKTINCAINGIYGIKDFEKLADSLV